VFDLVDQAVDFVMSKIDLWVGTRKEGPTAPVEYEIPREVVAEAIVNAVAHRDYTSTGSVQVMLFSDRLEIWSPGELRPPMTLARLTKPHPSFPVNPLIAEPLYLSKYIEKAGSGTLDMLKLCLAAGLHPPEFRMDVGCFVVSIHRKRLTGSGEAIPAQAQVEAQEILTELELKMLLSCREGSMSGQELLSIAGYASRTGNFKRSLEKLLQTDFLEMTIPDKPKSSKQRYRLTAKGKAVLEK